MAASTANNNNNQRSALSKQSKSTTAGSKKSVRFADEDDYTASSGMTSGVTSPRQQQQSVEPSSTSSSATSSATSSAISSSTSPSITAYPAPPPKEPPKVVVEKKEEPPEPQKPTTAPEATSKLKPNMHHRRSIDSIMTESLVSMSFHADSTIPSRSPIEQGVLNDCWLLSTALAFWRAPHIASKFAKQISKFCYLIRLWNIGCEWESYRVHQSNLPQSGGVTIHSGFADYVRYVEAAFLGYFQSAESLAKALGDPVESFVWLTGGFAERLLFNQSEVLDRKIFAMLSNSELFSAVQQSTTENKRHSCSIAQWEKLPFGSGNRFLVIDSNFASEAPDDSSSHHQSAKSKPMSHSASQNHGSRTSILSASTLSSAISALPASSQSRRLSSKNSNGSSNQADSKAELIAQIARQNPNLTSQNQQQDENEHHLGALTGWYTPQRLASTFDSCTICRPIIQEEADDVKPRMVQLMSSWIPDHNSGGSRRNLENFATNPQFIFKLHLTGSPTTSGPNPPGPGWTKVDGLLPWLWVSLCQPFRLDKSNYSHIAFHAYKLPHKDPPASPLRASFFLHNAELFSSLPYANYSMATKSYSDQSIPQTPPTIPRFTSALYRDDVDIHKGSAPVVYLLVVPSTYFPVKARTEFLLRVFSEIGELSFHSAWNFDPKTVNVPWALFHPESIDFAPGLTDNNTAENGEKMTSPRKNSLV